MFLDQLSLVADAWHASRVTGYGIFIAQQMMDITMFLTIYELETFLMHLRNERLISPLGKEWFIDIYEARNPDDEFIRITHQDDVLDHYHYTVEDVLKIIRED